MKLEMGFKPKSVQSSRKITSSRCKSFLISLRLQRNANDVNNDRFVCFERSLCLHRGKNLVKYRDSTRPTSTNNLLFYTASGSDMAPTSTTPFGIVVMKLLDNNIGHCCPAPICRAEQREVMPDEKTKFFCWNNCFPFPYYTH